MGVFNRNGGMRVPTSEHVARQAPAAKARPATFVGLEMLWGDRTGSTRALRWETPTRFHISIFCNLYGV